MDSPKAGQYRAGKFLRAHPSRNSGAFRSCGQTGSRRQRDGLLRRNRRHSIAHQPLLLDKVLRQEWGFPGYVVSDGNGLQMLVETHHVAADKAEAARKALAAGVDFDLSDGSVYATIEEQ